MPDTVPVSGVFIFMNNKISFIGSGAPGGKGSGLIRIQSLIDEYFSDVGRHGISVGVPEMTVILSDVFTLFINENKLRSELINNKTDEQISLLFNKASFPPFLIGEVRKISNGRKGPLAIRSSSLTEDSLNRPFAGLFATKMIPNNHPDPDVRFLQLINAVKFVYSSVWFEASRDSFKSAGIDIDMERMAVIIQRVHGKSYGRYFYPAFSGVGRSYNYYPFSGCKPESGIVELAAGLGKTIVDGGRKWIYSPEKPASPPPASLKNLLDAGQTDFWAIDLKPPDKESPLDEKEFLSLQPVKSLEESKIISSLCSTYSRSSDRLEMGFLDSGFKLIDFSPILKGEIINLNRLVTDILDKCREKTGSEIEIEFAVNIDFPQKPTADFAFLQIRPMKRLNTCIVPDISSFDRSKLVAYTDNALGNVYIENVEDFVYINPQRFSALKTAEMPLEIERINRKLVVEGKRYILSGFGRWGSSDPALGIPVSWSQISGASVIIESTLPEMNPELSQGSHFFHNILNTDTVYFSIDSCSRDNDSFIDYNYLESQQTVFEGKFFKHIKFEKSIKIIADGNTRKGIIIL